MSAFALSAAALFLGGCDKKDSTTTTPEPTATADPEVKCFGVNECSGQSVCAVNKPDLGIEHACAGENECEGKGWIKLSQSACAEQNGESLGVL